MERESSSGGNLSSELPCVTRAPTLHHYAPADWPLLVKKSDESRRARTKGNTLRTVLFSLVVDPVLDAVCAFARRRYRVPSSHGSVALLGSMTDSFLSMILTPADQQARCSEVPITQPLIPCCIPPSVSLHKLGVGACCRQIDEPQFTERYNNSSSSVALLFG